MILTELLSPEDNAEYYGATEFPPDVVEARARALSALEAVVEAQDKADKVYDQYEVIFQVKMGLELPIDEIDLLRQEAGLD